MADHGRKGMAGGAAARRAAMFAEAEAARSSLAGTVAPLAVETRTVEASGALEGVPDSLAARMLLFDDLPRDQQPTTGDRVLLVGLVWGDSTLVELQTCEAGADLPLHRLAGLSSLFPHRFPLVKHTADGHVFTLPGTLPAEVHQHGAVRALPSAGPQRRAGGEWALGNDDRIVAQVGPHLTLVARYVRAAPQARESAWRRIDGAFAAILLLALALLSGFLLAVARAPQHDASWRAEIARDPQAYARYQVRPSPPAQAPAPEAPKKELSGVKEGEKSAGEEGKVGKPEAPKKEAAPSRRGAPDPKKKAEADLRRVKKLGLLAALGKVGVPAAPPDLLGPGGIGSGVQRTLGGTRGGGATGDALGTNGLGTRGAGSGGGGHALGIGGLGTRGAGHGRGGYGQVDLGGRGKDETVFVPGRTVVVGGLSRDVINRVIQRHYNEIRYCYEKELAKDPSLYGKISISFVIDGGGSVADALVQQSTMGSEPVESCIVDHVRRWAFPQPEGGSTVQVTYPYVFKASGQ